MHIRKDILFGRLSKFIGDKYHKADKGIIISLCRQVIHNDCTKNGILKGKSSNWKYLPKSKSLFHSPEGCGLPIGNLTSQIFANFYMDSFDHFIKHDLGLKNYGRYVDDFYNRSSRQRILKIYIAKSSGLLKDKFKFEFTS